MAVGGYGIGDADKDTLAVTGLAQDVVRGYSDLLDRTIVDGWGKVDPQYLGVPGDSRLGEAEVTVGWWGERFDTVYLRGANIFLEKPTVAVEVDAGHFACAVYELDEFVVVGQVVLNEAVKADDLWEDEDIVTALFFGVKISFVGG